MDVSNKFDASPSMAGYFYQLRYALLLALRSERGSANSHISIEKLDDIAVQSDDHVTCLIQAKHHGKPGNLTDKSVDLWKTLRIWCETISRDSSFVLDKQFIIVTTQSAKEGSIASLLRPRSSRQNSSEILSLLENVAKQSDNSTTLEARNSFLNLALPVRRSLVEAIVVLDKSPDLVDVRTEIEHELRFAESENRLSALADSVEGWWLDTVAKMLVNPGSAPIPVIEIKRKIEEYNGRADARSLPLLPKNTPSGSKSKTLRQSKFVAQMELIGLQESVIDRGIRDYLKSKTQRSQWAREKLLMDGENQRYDTELIDKWERISDSSYLKYDQNSERDQVNCGREVFITTTGAPIHFRDRTEIWLSAGAYHALAEKLSVGWHPKFKSLLSK